MSWDPASGETVRFVAPQRPHHRSRLGHGPGGQPAPADEPATRTARASSASTRHGIDHVFLMCEDVDGATAFFSGRARLSAHRADHGRRRPSARARSSNGPTRPHDIAFITGPERGAAPLRLLARRLEPGRATPQTCAPTTGSRIDAGPTRHGATRGYGLYFFDPAGNRNEVYTGGYWADPDREPVTWTESDMGRAIFYYEGVVNQRFLTEHS